LPAEERTVAKGEEKNDGPFNGEVVGMRKGRASSTPGKKKNILLFEKKGPFSRGGGDVFFPLQLGEEKPGTERSRVIEKKGVSVAGKNTAWGE